MIIINFIKSHWNEFVFLVPVLISFLNAATKHWSNQKGVVKWLTFITEILSFMASRDTEGFLKLPLTSKKPEKSVKGTSEGGKIASLAVPFLLCVFASSHIGCTTLRGKIEVAHQATVIASDIGASAFHAQCTSKATGCKQAGDTVCLEWQKCDAQRKQFGLIILSVEDNLKALNRIIQVNDLK